MPRFGDRRKGKAQRAALERPTLLNAVDEVLRATINTTLYVGSLEVVGYQSGCSIKNFEQGGMAAADSIRRNLQPMLEPTYELTLYLYGSRDLYSLSQMLAPPGWRDYAGLPPDTVHKSFANYYAYEEWRNTDEGSAITVTTYGIGIRKRRQ